MIVRLLVHRVWELVDDVLKERKPTNPVSAEPSPPHHAATPVQRRNLVAGELLEIEGWYFIDDADVCADFIVTWRHPKEGVGRVYRAGGCGFQAPWELGPAQLAAIG